MRKLLSSIIILLLLVIILWGGSSWYLGAKAEKAFKAYLQQNSQVAGKRLFRTELLAYKKTLTGARAKLQISSDFPMITEQLGELRINLQLINGPLFVNQSDISFGSSYWNLSIDQNTDQSTNLKQLYKIIFPQKLPKAVIRIDFENKAHYSTKVKTLWAEAFITGIFNLDTEDNRGAFKLNDFSFTHQLNTISAKNIKLSYQHQKALTTSFKPGTASIQIPSLKIQHQKLQKPLLIDLKANSNISMKGDQLGGFIKMNIKNIYPDNQPFETGVLTVLFSGLSADGFVAFTEANADIDNLHQQTQWALEELGELPEGQDQIWQLYDEIEESSQQLPPSLVKIGKNSLIQLKAVSNYHDSKSQLTGEIKLEKDKPNINSWLSLLDGEASVSLDEHLYTSIKKQLPIKQKNFTLKFKNNKLLLVQ